MSRLAEWALSGLVLAALALVYAAHAAAVPHGLWHASYRRGCARCYGRARAQSRRPVP